MEWNKVFILAAIILHNWSTVVQRYSWWDSWLELGLLDVILLFTWAFFWNKPCPMDKPYLPVPLMLYGGCSLLVVLFIMVVIVGMIALVINLIISVSILDWYDLFCLNKGNVLIFQVTFFFLSDLNKQINPEIKIFYFQDLSNRTVCMCVALLLIGWWQGVNQ